MVAFQATGKYVYLLGLNYLRGAALIGPIAHFISNLLAQQIDGHLLTFALETPIGPAVAAGRAFQRSAHLMDRTFDIGGRQRAIGAHFYFMPPV